MTNFPVKINHLGKKTNGLKKVAMVSTITAFAVLSSVIPSLSRNFRSLDFSQSAYGQSSAFSHEIIWRYAAAILDIEPIREKHFAPVKNLYRGNVPAQVCDQSNLSDQVNQICNDYKRESAFILKHYQVIGSFNKITSQLKYDEQLRQQIRQAITCQQKRITMTSCF